MRSMLQEGCALQPNARTLWEIQEKARRLPAETASALYCGVLEKMRDALALSRQRRESVHDAATLAGYQRTCRELFLNCIGGVPEPCHNAQLVSRTAHEGFTLEKILLQPREGSWASANVYIPATPPAQGKYPAVLITVGHDNRGKADPAYQYLAQALCHAGMMALVLDPLGQGDRFEHYEASVDLQPIHGCSGEHDLLDWKAKLTGVSLARYFVQDGIAALDYLCSREDVDPARIGLTGHSGGGTQTCMLMIAAGDRFACAAPCAYVTDTRAMVENGVDPDNEMIWPGSLAAGLDYVDVIAGVAPRPVLLLSNQHDFFPREGTHRTLAAARELWQRAGAAILPDMNTAPSEHAYSPDSAHAAASFFARHLTQGTFDEGSFRFTLLSGDDLHCTPGAQILRHDPAMRTVHDEIIGEMAQCRKVRGALTEADTLAQLQSLLHTERVYPDPDPRVFAEGVCGHYNYRCVFYQTFEGDRCGGVFLRDIRQGDAPLPTVLALWSEGTQRIAEHSHWIHQAVSHGWQVFIPDVAGSGALLPNLLSGSPMYIGWSTLYHLNAYLMQLDDSLFAQRACQLMGSIHLLQHWPEADEARLCLYAEGDCARYALAVAPLTGTPLYEDAAFEDYEDIVTQRYHDQTHTHAWILPGALRCFDFPQLRALCGQHHLLAADPACADAPFILS